jgi:hypothetical protein
MSMVNKGVRKLSPLIVIVVCLASRMLQAGVGIRPAYVELNMDTQKPAGVFFITNNGDKQERYRVNAVHFTYTETGTLVMSQTGESSLAPWIHFNPRELVIDPNTERAVRFAIVPRGQLKPGEYWAAMELESLAVQEATTSDEKSGVSMKLKTITSIVAPIFATIGKVSYEGKIKDLQVQVENGSTILKVLVAATATGRLGVRSNYEIVDASGKIIDKGPVDAGYVLRGMQRRFTKKIEGPVANGRYTVKVSCTAAHLAQPLTKEIQVTWPDAPPAQAQAVEPAQGAAAAKPENQTKSSMDGDKQPKAQGRVD